MNNFARVAPRREAKGLWAITSYFNPVGYRQRLANYRVFRERLGIPLVAVELAFGPEFELREGDAEILVQLRGGDVMWQKERLLNVALASLPSTCGKVTWLDCDVIFEANDWPERLNRLLDSFKLVQPFGQVHYLSRDGIPGEIWPTEVEYVRTSVASEIASGVPASITLGHRTESLEGTSATGLAWAACRELLDQHGFYDGCIVGAGDRALACAAHGCFNEFIGSVCMNEQEKERFMAWARPFYQAVCGATGYLEGNLFHLWHGEARSRRALARHKELGPFDFNPFEDIVIDRNGCWRWNTNKPEMHEYMRKYFASRKDDG